MIDLSEILDTLTDMQERYLATADGVSAWAEDLANRVRNSEHMVTLAELLAVVRIFDDGEWLPPSLAAAAVREAIGPRAFSEY